MCLRLGLLFVYRPQSRVATLSISQRPARALVTTSQFVFNYLVLLMRDTALNFTKKGFMTLFFLYILMANERDNDNLALGNKAPL